MLISQFVQNVLLCYYQFFLKPGVGFETNFAQTFSLETKTFPSMHLSPAAALLQVYVNLAQLRKIR